MTSLEAVARLAWSDDGARQEVADLGGIPLIIAAMRRNPGQEGVQCNACLALMALVRGEGPVCQVNIRNINTVFVTTVILPLSLPTCAATRAGGRAVQRLPRPHSPRAGRGACLSGRKVGSLSYKCSLYCTLHIPCILSLSCRNPGQEGVQCNAGLGLMALVRGEGPVCQVGKAGHYHTNVHCL
jgi:hypothetical protein